MTEKPKDIAERPVAIIGMGCFFPRSAGLKEYWRLLYHGYDAITPIPPTHWSPEDYFDRDPKKPDHVYCQRGGFLSPVAFDPSEFGIPPAALEATDTSQLLGLMAAKMALEDTGYGPARAFDRSRTSVILGVTGTQELVIPLSSRLGHPIWRRALRDCGLSPETTEAVVARIADAFVPWQENSFPGLLGNVVAGRISNRLDLGGTNCVVDAACGSSLGAVHLALLELWSHRSDMVVTGGVDTLNDIFMHMCFAKTSVLSPTGDARPFSQHADGTVLGEGVGMVILKRLEDAERDGDRIYAVIRSLGASSDGKSQSIYAPRAEGQSRALQGAYDQAGIDTATVELIEAHGTGTRVGDRVEFQALCQVFGRPAPNGRRCAIGSVKSMIGHTKAAAGVAGLIKGALALHHKVLPPTLKVGTPDTQLGIDQSPFYLNTESRPWVADPLHPRRAGVSAFGFGGSNFHVVLEEYTSAKPRASWDGAVEIFALSAPSRTELLKRLQDCRGVIETDPSPRGRSVEAARTRETFAIEDPFRLLLLVEAEQSPDVLLEAQKRLEAGTPMTRDADRAGGNLFYGESAAPGKMAFLFPGQGSQYPGMGRDLICFFPEALQAIEQANALFEDGRLSDIVFPLPTGVPAEQQKAAETLRQTETAQPAIGSVSLAMLKVLQRFGLRPAATCGHSFGELTALCAAGWVSSEAFLGMAVARGRIMGAAGRRTGRKGAMLAVRAPIAEIERLIADGRLDVTLANRNSPDQGVLSGAAEIIAECETRCRDKGFTAVRLSVGAAFHSRQVSEAGEPFLQYLENIEVSPTAIPVFANTTATPYPSDSRQARQLLGNQIAQPVDFMTAIRNMYRAGVRTFVEVGPGGVLTRLVASILKDDDVLPVALDSSKGGRFGVADLGRVLCHLAARGHQVDLKAWEEGILPGRRPRMQISILGANHHATRPSAAAPPGGVVSASGPDTGKPPVPAGPTQPAGRTPASVTDDRRSAVRCSSNTFSNSPPLPPMTSACAARSQTAATAGGRMPPMKKQQNPENLGTALSVVQEGLKSMQALQKQTAEAHQKFLETQTEASRALQSMMAQTQGLIEAFLGSEAPVRDPLGHADWAQALEPQPSRPPTETVEEGNPANVSQLAVAPVIPFRKKEVSTVDDPGHLSMASQAAQTASAPAVSSELAQTLLAVVGRLTGYPEEMLNLEMDIEADLGIDSIKRVEILSALEEGLPGLPAVSPEVMGGLKTLGQIVDYLQGDTSVPPNPEIPDEPLDSAAAPVAVYDEGTLQRQVVRFESSAFTPGPELKIPTDKVIFITEDDTGLAHHIAKEFTRMHLTPQVLSADRIQGDLELRNAGGLVLVAGTDTDVAFLKNAFRLVRRIAAELRQTAREADALLASVTRMDGAFGFKNGRMANPFQGGIGGLVKSAAVEWPEVCCRALDVAPDWPDDRSAARAIVTDLLCGGPQPPVEAGLVPEGRLLPVLERAPAPQGDIQLKTGDLVVITGGARGVTAAAAHRLAETCRPALLLLGRSAEPFPEPEWLFGADDEAAMKAAILISEFNRQASPKQIETAYQKYRANREITGNIDRMRQCGAAVVYRSVDVRDFEALDQAVNGARRAHGPVRAVIHGAGVLHDRRIVDKTPQQFDLVFDTKVIGFQALMAAVRSDELKYLILFSSVTARFGNVGQVDYAMANEVLNKTAHQEARRREGCKVLAINWGPWDGGMVDASLKRQFRHKGIPLISLEAGSRALIAEMGGASTDPVEVLIGTHLLPGREESRQAHRNQASPDRPASREQSTGLTVALKREIDLENLPILQAHILGGKPVVPLSLMTEWLGQGALHENPGLFLHGIDNLRLLKGIQLDRGKRLIRLLAGKTRKKGSRYEVDVEIRDGVQDGREIIHSSAMAILTDSIPAPPVFENTLGQEVRAYSRSIEEIYDRILFHGRELRGIREITGYSSRGMVARLAPAPNPAAWMTDPLRSAWIGDPLVLDAAFQMAIVWCFEEMGQVSLPSFCKSYRQYCTRFPADGVTGWLEVRQVGEHKMVGDFTFLDTQDSIVAHMSGYEAVLDPSLIRAFKPQVDRTV